MADSTSGPHIQLHDFTIRSSLPLPELLRHPSRLALKFSVHGVGEEMLSARGGIEYGIWKVDRDVEICDDQLLTVTILVCVEDSTKELGSVTISYSQLLARAKARSRECHEFPVDGSTFSALMLFTCYIRISVTPPRKQRIFTELVPSLGESKSNGGPIGSNRALTPDVLSASSLADLELQYAQSASLPTERKSQAFNAIGCAYQDLYTRTYKMEHLEMAILILGEALQNASFDPRLPKYLNNLSMCLLKRFERTGSHDDIEQAISKSQDAVRFAKLDDPNKHRYILFIDKVLGLVPDSHPDKPIYLNSLGATLEERFYHLGHIEDLEIAITHKQKAVDLLPDSHQHKAGYLSNLGDSFGMRFDRLGHVEDLEIAITHKQRAVNLTLDGHPDKPRRLNNLALFFRIRFKHLGRVEDLEISIMHQQKVVDLTLDNHPDKPNRLNNLGIALETRFDRLGRVSDLEMAILHKQKAVDLITHDHPDKPDYINGLARAFLTRFSRLDRVEDLEKAIVLQQKVVDLTPDGHPHKPSSLKNLGIAFATRFERLGRSEDLELAIAHNQKAVDLTPDAHPDKASYLIALGIAFILRFTLLGQPDDVRMAIIQYSAAASLSTGSPRIRLNAVMYWAEACELLESSGESLASPLEPYHIAIDLLPRVAWLGIPISTQHALLEEIGGIVREAVSAAIKVEEYKTALEWTEAGRSIAWQNLLNLRTPVNELRSAHYDLANRLETISRQLDISMRESDSRINDGTSGTEEVPRSHVQLALDWDNTVADIRSKRGFELFLRPRSFNQLVRIVRDGPVVTLDITEDRCDALVLIPEDNGDVYISNISLSGFSLAKSEALLKELKQLLRS